MEALRQIPPVNDVLKAPELSGFRSILETAYGMKILDEVMEETRRQVASAGIVVARTDLTSRIARETARRLADLLRPSLRRVINASGVVLHTNLGRAPLSETVIQHLREVAVGYSNLEFSIEDGLRGKRDHHIERLLRHLLGCESAIVVNNNAAAVLIVLNTLGESGEVIVSRGEQVEIGGSFRIPDVMARSGARLREVGTTNRTRIGDYEHAINETTRLLLRVHPSNFRIIGFTERPSLEEFVALGRRRNIATFEDLGSGCLIDLQPLGIRDEPVAVESIRAGIDVICFSGDKLLGGPQAGIIAGKKHLVGRIRQNPLFRALRVDKLTIASLESVLLSYIRGAVDDIPIWRMLRTPASTLQDRAAAFAARTGKIAQPVQLTSVVGGGSAPEMHLSSWGVTLKINGLSAAEIERRLRHSDPPVIVRIEEDQIVLDLRTVAGYEEDALLAAITAIES